MVAWVKLFRVSARRQVLRPGARIHDLRDFPFNGFMPALVTFA